MIVDGIVTLAVPRSCAGGRWLWAWSAARWFRTFGPTRLRAGAFVRFARWIIRKLPVCDVFGACAVRAPTGDPQHEEKVRERQHDDQAAAYELRRESHRIGHELESGRVERHDVVQRAAVEE
jgi:hypothetical protein